MLSNEKQEDFIVITRALEKEHIDEIISISVGAGAVSLVLFGGRVCACRSLHGRLMMALRAIHARRLARVVHLITTMCSGCAGRAAKVPSAGRSKDRGW